MTQSHPPSSSPSAEVRKAVSASATVIWPKGSSGRPSGPIEPATKALTPTISRAARATLTPWRASSRASPSSPCAARRTGFAPKVLVSMSSAPALRYSRWMASTSAGWERLSSSKHWSKGIPRS